jgi:hypothetical protein
MERKIHSLEEKLRVSQDENNKLQQQLEDALLKREATCGDYDLRFAELLKEKTEIVDTMTKKHKEDIHGKEDIIAKVCSAIRLCSLKFAQMQSTNIFKRWRNVLMKRKRVCK